MVDCFHISYQKVTPMRPIQDFCCQNKECPLHGKKNAKNLYFRGWSGKKKTIRMICCRTCKARFSERKGTPLFGICMPEEKATNVFLHLADGNGIRQTARLTGVNKSTVCRFAKIAGEHAEKVHEELMAFSPRDRRNTARRKMGVCRQKGRTVRPRKPR